MEPAWTVHSHPDGEQEMWPKGVGKHEEADVCRARHQPALEGLPAPVNDGEGSLLEQAAAGSGAHQRP